MAGIGFVLRKMAREDNFLGAMKAYFYSALISTGPWLFTVLIIGSIVLLSEQFIAFEALEHFRLIIIYNFCFSFVLSGPSFLIATRFLADALHKRDASAIPGMLVGALVCILGGQFPFVFSYVHFVCGFPILLSLSASSNYLLIAGMWLSSLFLSALSDYKTM